MAWWKKLLAMVWKSGIVQSKIDKSTGDKQ
jgi:hypothetical protein